LKSKFPCITTAFMTIPTLTWLPPRNLSILLSSRTPARKMFCWWEEELVED
jgi:hypothetical protein